jgi:hypothetical protein
VQPGVDVPNQKEQSMSYNKQETPNTKGKKKVRRRRRTTTTHHHHHFTFCPYSNHRELRLKTIQPNMAKAMDDIVGGLIFLPIISLAWRRRFICDLQLDPVASSPRPGHCFSSNGTNF